jgi:hypothetical protein
MSVDVSVMSFLKSAAILQSKKAVLKNGQKKGHFLSVFGGTPEIVKFGQKSHFLANPWNSTISASFVEFGFFGFFDIRGGVPNFKVIDPTRFVNVTGDPDE